MRQTPITNWRNMRVVVMGLGRFGGGVGVARWLARQKARVLVTDVAPAESLADSIAALNDQPDITLRLGRHAVDDLDNADLAVINPAVRKDQSPFFQEILRRGLPWTTELNLLCERLPCACVGISGSFGKSTTAAMLHRAVKANLPQTPFRNVLLGGNIGVSLLPDLPDMTPDDLVILEISNAQLEDFPQLDWRPRTAVLTNIHPHHLDRHGNFESYVRTKLQLAGQATRTIITGPIDPQANAIVGQTLARSPAKRIRVQHPLDQPLLTPGLHNRMNAATALAAGESLGLTGDEIRQALASFAGLPHRLEHVTTRDGVMYYNDSKCTAPPGVLAAVQSFDQPVILIVGGKSGETPDPALAQRIGVTAKAMIATGQNGPEWARAIDHTAANTVKVAGDLPDAIRHARRCATPGDAIVYSPGAPSFDAYDNFARRGEHFCALVTA